MKMIPVLIVFVVFLRATFDSVFADGGVCNDNNTDVPLLPYPVPPLNDTPVFFRLYMVVPLNLDASGNYEGIKIPSDKNICSCVSFLRTPQKKCGSSFIRIISLGGFATRVTSLNNYVSDKMSSTAESIKKFDVIEGAKRKILKGNIEKLVDNIFAKKKVYEASTIPEISKVNQSQVHCNLEKTDDYYISVTDNGQFGWVFVNDGIVNKTEGNVGIDPRIDARIQSSLSRKVDPKVRARMVKVELYGENGGIKLEQSMFSKP